MTTNDPNTSDNSESTVPKSVVVLSADLMDRSKISAAMPEAILVRSSAKLIEMVTLDSLVIVDLGRLDDLSLLAEIEARVIAFGSHVNEDQLAEAAAAGAEALPRSVFFRRLETGVF